MHNTNKYTGKYVNIHCTELKPSVKQSNILLNFDEHMEGKNL